MLLPHQRDFRVGPQIWACLQHVVTQVDLLMWLPGECSRSSHILMKHRAKARPTAGSEELLWDSEYGPIRAALVPLNVYNMTVRMNVHHLEDLVAKDGDWANTAYGFKRAGASDYHINIFRTWHGQHKTELRHMRVMAAPSWQTAPKKWKPLAVQPKTFYTVVGGREAKKEKTAVVVQGSYHLELDKEYMENRPSGSPAYLPMCDASNQGPYIDLYQVHSQCNAGPYASVLTGLQDRTAASRYQDRTGNTIV